MLNSMNRDNEYSCVLIFASRFHTVCVTLTLYDSVFVKRILTYMKNMGNLGCIHPNGFGWNHSVRMDLARYTSFRYPLNIFRVPMENYTYTFLER